MGSLPISCLKRHDTVLPVSLPLGQYQRCSVVTNIVLLSSSFADGTHLRASGAPLPSNKARYSADTILHILHQLSGQGGIRTLDLLRAKQALSLLSYSPILDGGDLVATTRASKQAKEQTLGLDRPGRAPPSAHKLTSPPMVPQVLDVADRSRTCLSAGPAI